MKEKIYKILPTWGQNLLCSIYGYMERYKRFTPEFNNMLNTFVALDRASRSELEAYQREKLQLLLLDLKENVPAYRDLYSIHEVESNPFSTLKELPLTDKKVIGQNRQYVTKTNIKKFAFSTSGTSGKGFSFYKDAKAISSQWAIWFRHRYRFGVREGDLHVNFMGKPVVPNLKAPFWRFNRGFNQYLVPMQVINETNSTDIVTFLNSIKPEFYSGYPSILSELARISIEKKLFLNEKAKPKFVFTGAEPLLETQKELIELWTGATVTQQYGMAEGVCNISECEFGRYHEDQEFGVIEKIEPTVNSDGSINAEIAGTSFFNFAQPFIRYRTGDSATWEPPEFRCECGRQTPVIRTIEGRIEDFVILKDGRKLKRFDYLFKSLPEIDEAQVVQYVKGKIEVHVVSKEEINKKEFYKQLYNFYGDALDAELIKVDKIKRENNGKFRSVKSFLNS